MNVASNALSPQNSCRKGVVRLDSQLGNPFRTERGLCPMYEGQNTRGGRTGSSESKPDPGRLGDKPLGLEQVR